MFMYKTSKSVYVFSVDCMHFSLFLDTLGYNFLHKYIFFLIFFDRLRDRKFPPILLI